MIEPGRVKFGPLKSVVCTLCEGGIGVGADISERAFRELLAKLGWENVRDADGREHWCCGRCCTQSIARASGAV